MPNQSPTKPATPKSSKKGPVKKKKTKEEEAVDRVRKSVIDLFGAVPKGTNGILANIVKGTGGIDYQAVEIFEGMSTAGLKAKLDSAESDASALQRVASSFALTVPPTSANKNTMWKVVEVYTEAMRKRMESTNVRMTEKTEELLRVTQEFHDLAKQGITFTSQHASAQALTELYKVSADFALAEEEKKKELKSALKHGQQEAAARLEAEIAAKKAEERVKVAEARATAAEEKLEAEKKEKKENTMLSRAIKTVKGLSFWSSGGDKENASQNA